MFGKLLKYEFKNVNKWYLALYTAILGLSVVIGLWASSNIKNSSNTFSHFESQMTGGDLLFILTVMIFGIMIAALFLSTFFLIILRFRNTVYGKEGYLTLTLPVTEHQIILSKFLAAMIWTLLSGLTLLLSILIVMGFYIHATGANLTTLLADVQWREVFGHLSPFALSNFMSSVNSILLVYLAISVAQLFENYRTAIGITFYLVINIIPNFLLETSLGSSGLSSLVDINADYSAIYTTIGYDLLTAIIFYFGTHYILKNKVNLQ